MLDVQQKEGAEPVSLSVEDPASEEFYINTWMKTAHSNTDVYEEVRVDNCGLYSYFLACLALR